MPWAFVAAIAAVLLVPPALGHGSRRMDPASGSGNAHNNVQSTVIANYILRVLFGAQRLGIVLRPT